MSSKNVFKYLSTLIYANGNLSFIVCLVCLLLILTAATSSYPSAENLSHGEEIYFEREMDLLQEQVAEEEDPVMRHQPDPNGVEDVSDLWSDEASIVVPELPESDEEPGDEGDDYVPIPALLPQSEDTVVSLSDGDLYLFNEAGTFDSDMRFEFTPEMEIQPPTEPITHNHLMQSFELSVFDPATNEQIHEFDHPMRVVLDMRKYGIDLDEQGGEFFFAYRNPLNHDELIDVPIKTYKEDGLYTADVTHFSDWATGWRPEQWALHWDLPTAGGFNGAANYTYPIEVPPGHNGMQPMINLSYSSSALNGAMRDVSGGMIAAGWSVSEIAVVRTNIRLNSAGNEANKEQTYRIVLNGAGHELAATGRNVTPGGNAGSGKEYVLKDSPTIRAIRFGNDTKSGKNLSDIGGIYWVVQTGGGKTYRLGSKHEAKTIYEVHCKCADSNTREILVQRFESEWHVDTVVDEFGNQIVYERDNSGDTIANERDVPTRIKTFGSRVTKIHYNFNGVKPTGLFEVDGADQNTEAAATFVEFKYDGIQLNSIEVTHDKGQFNFPTRKYEFEIGTLTYNNQCTENHQSRTSATKVVLAITESSRVTNQTSAWKSLPSQKFGYEPLSNFSREYSSSAGVNTNGNCFNFHRLNTISNGYGAKIRFTYHSFKRGLGSYKDSGSGPIEYPSVTDSWFVEYQTVDDGFGHQTITKFDNISPCFIQKLGEDRCANYTEHGTPATDLPDYSSAIGGFETVSAEVLAFDSNTVLNRVVTTYNQGNIGFGQPKLVKTYNRNGHLVSWTKTDYHNLTRNGAAFRPVSRREVRLINPTGNNESTTARQTTVETFTYSSSPYGQLQKSVVEVDGATDQETTYTYYDPASNSHRWWINRPKTQTVKSFRDNSNGETVSATTYRYMSGGKEYTTPTEVDVTAGGKTLTTKTAFDGRGNVVTTTDANNQTTTIVYDSQSNLYPVRVTNAEGHCTAFLVYGFSDKNCGGTGLGNINQGKPGLLYGVIDPSGDKTSYKYDEHGRLVETYLPNDSTYAVKHTYSDFATPFQVKTETRSGAAPTTIQYYDGLGRPIMTEQQGVEIGDSVNQKTLALTGYDELGQVVRQTTPIQNVTVPSGFAYSWSSAHNHFELISKRYYQGFEFEIENAQNWTSVDAATKPILFDGFSFLSVDMVEGAPYAEVVRQSDTRNQSGDDIWEFDVAVRNPGGADVWFGIKRGTDPTSTQDGAPYKQIMIKAGKDGSQFQVFGWSEDSGFVSPGTQNIISWKEEGNTNYSKWYTVKIRRIEGSGKFIITMTQRDDASETRTLTYDAGSAFNATDWDARFIVLGTESSLYVDNYYEYARKGDRNPEGTSTIYAHSAEASSYGLTHPSDMVVIAPDGNTTKTESRIVTNVAVDGYSKMLKQTVWDAENNKTESYTNSLGQLARVREFNTIDTNPFNIHVDTDYHYDDQGNLATVIRRGGVQANSTTLGGELTRTTMGYDDFGRKTSMQDPDMGNWVYEYDDNGNLTAQRDAENQWLCFSYDSLNRMTQKWVGSGSHIPNKANCSDTSNWIAQWGYDTASNGEGKLHTVTWQGKNDTTDQDRYFYNSDGLLSAQERQINGQKFKMEYEYDVLDRPVKTTYPDGSESEVTYDKMGVNTLKVDTVDYVTNVTHTKLGQINQIIRGAGGQVTTYSYHSKDDNYRLSSIGHGSLGTYSYEYDKVGNIIELTDSGVGNGKVKFNYDDLYRLTSTQKISGATYPNQTYKYDELGNMIQKNGVINSYDVHAIISTSDGGSFGYDDNGNMISRTEQVDGNLRTFTQIFDVENRLTLVEEGGEETFFYYDPSGQRTMTIDPHGNITYFPFAGYEETHQISTPVSTSTPIPTSTNTPEPVQTSTLVATNTPEPTATNTLVPTNTPTVTPTDTPLDDLIREAESGTVFGDFVIGSDPQASGSQFVWVPSELDNEYSFNPANRVVYTFDIRNPGIYKLRAIVRTDVGVNVGAGDSVYVGVDSETAHLGEPWHFGSQDFEYGLYPDDLELTEGIHKIVLFHRESGTQIDTIRLDKVGNLSTATPEPSSTPLPTSTPVSPPAGNDDWVFRDGHGSYVNGSDSQIRVTGTGSNYNATIWRKGDPRYTSGEKINFDFYVDQKNSRTHLGIVKPGSTDFERFAIYENGGSLRVQLYRKGQTTVFGTLLSSSEFQANTWYKVSITIDDEYGFLVEVEQRDNPSVKGFYRDTDKLMSGGQEWRFRGLIYQSSFHLDDYRSEDVILTPPPADDWIFKDGHGSYVDGSNSQIQVTGTGANYNAATWRKGDPRYANGEKISFDFYVDQKNSRTHLGIVKPGSTDFERFAIYENGGSLRVQLYRKGETTVFGTLLSSSEFQANAWYKASITIDDTFGFLLEVEQRDNPAIKGSYRDTDKLMSGGQEWRFRGLIYQSSFYLDSYGSEEVTLTPPPADDWIFKDGHGSYLDGSNSQIQVTGTGSNYNAATWRKGDPRYTSGEKISFDFYVDQKNSRTHLGIVKPGSTDFERFAIFENGGSLRVQLYRKGQTTAYGTLLSASEFQANTWYKASIMIDDSDGFLLEVEQRDNPAIKGSYRDTDKLMSSGEEWRFRGLIYQHTVFVDNYAEQAVSETSCGPLSQEAETGQLSGNFESQTSGPRTFIVVPEGSGTSSSDIAEYCVDITQAGEYRISTLMSADADHSDSFFVKIGSNYPSGGYIWDMWRTDPDYFDQDFVNSRSNPNQNPLIVFLSEDEHILQFIAREDGAKLDKFTLQYVGSGAQIPRDNSKNGGVVLAMANDQLPSFGPLTQAEFAATQNNGTVDITVRKTFMLGSTPIIQQSYSKTVANDPDTMNGQRRNRGNATTLYLYTDHLGSANTTTNGSGGNVQYTRYMPFGEVWDVAGDAVLDTTGRGFTGHRENRDLGLTYMNARFYVPGIGRFATADTIVPDLSNSQAFNRFTYVNNNPVNYNDPSGHCRLAVGKTDADGNQLYDCAASDNEEDGTIFVNDRSREYKIWYNHLWSVWDKMISGWYFNSGRNFADFKEWALDGGLYFYESSFDDLNLPTGGNRLLGYQPILANLQDGRVVTLKRKGQPVYILNYTDVSGVIRSPGQALIVPLADLSIEQQEAFESFVANANEFASHHNGAIPIGVRNSGQSAYAIYDLRSNMKNAKAFSRNAVLSLDSGKDGLRMAGFAWAYDPKFFTDGIKPPKSTGIEPLFR